MTCIVSWGVCLRPCCSTDYRAFETQPGSVYFNNPGHIKQFSVEFVDELYLIALQENFLKENVHVNIFEELYLQIEAAYRSASPYRWKLIGHLFAAILFKIKEYFWKDYDPIADGDRASQIVKSFAGVCRHVEPASELSEYGDQDEDRKVCRQLDSGKDHYGSEVFIEEFRYASEGNFLSPGFPGDPAFQQLL